MNSHLAQKLAPFLPYRPNSGAILHRGDGRILMGERRDAPGVWQFPQGGVEPGESKEEAMWRELSEELGLWRPRRLCSLIAVGPQVRYNFPQGVDWPIARRYAGQEQTLFLLEYYGTNDDIDVHAHEEREFSRFRWVGFLEARELFRPEKREVLTRSIIDFLDKL